MYQPLPPNDSGEFYGVGGLSSFGLSYEESSIQGVTKETATEIVRVCNDNPEFVKNFIAGIKTILGLIVV